MSVTFKNGKTGEMKNIKVGWSWILFFGTLFLLGIPHFLRGLVVWGILAAVLNLLGLFFLNVPSALMTLSIVQLGLAIFLFIKGNEITAKNYLEKNWEIIDPESLNVKNAKSAWGLA